jgi:sugar phosphate isomerase/epimerase
MKRRTFLKTSAGATLLTNSLFNIGYSLVPNKLDKIGIQLYSVRDLMRDDFEGTITKVAEIGYDQVEFAGYYDRDPKDIRDLLDKLGLTSPASHLGYNLLQDDTLKQTIETAKILGNKYLILPSLPRERSGQQRPRPQGQQRPQEGQPRQRPPQPTFTADKVKEFIDIFNHIGESCKNSGLKFAFHNHQTEFQEIEGHGIMFDMLLKGTEPDLVDYEIDLGWAVAAGADPLAYLEKYPGRFKLFHVKEVDRTTLIGEGKIDFATIFSKSKQAGVLYYIVEFEGREKHIESISKSLNYLKNLTF